MRQGCGYKLEKIVRRSRSLIPYSGSTLQYIIKARGDADGEDGSWVYLASGVIDTLRDAINGNQFKPAYSSSVRHGFLTFSTRLSGILSLITLLYALYVVKLTGWITMVACCLDLVIC